MPLDRTIQPFDEGVEITVPGYRLVVPELSLSQRERLEPEILKWTAGSETSDKERLEIAYKVVQTALSRHYPEVTVEEVKDLFTARKLATALRAAVAGKEEGTERPLASDEVQANHAAPTGSKSTDA